jgi:activating signal cointegrator 1
MKCISVWEPWASLLACGHKAYETRSWSPPASCMKVDVAIHAAQSLAGMSYLDHPNRDERLVEICDRVLGRDHPFAFGHILAVGQIGFTIPTVGMIADEVMVEERRMGDWSPGRYAWRFLNVRRLRHPVRCRGRQMFFELPADALAAVQAQL